MAVGRPVDFGSLRFRVNFLLVRSGVFRRGSEALAEGAHGLVDEGGEGGAVVALEARVVEIVVPNRNWNVEIGRGKRVWEESGTGRFGSDLHIRCGQRQG